MKTQTNKGFTLIELLVVIAIIGILAAVVLVSLNSARQKSRDAKRVADIRQIMTALELFYNDNNKYPLPATASTAGPSLADGTSPYLWSSLMPTWPTAPTPAETGCSTAQNTYTYTQMGAGTGYSLTFCVGAVTGGLSAGSHTASAAGIQ